MGIGMKTRNDNSTKGTFNQEPKKKSNKQQSQLQSRPKKRVSDAQWQTLNNKQATNVQHSNVQRKKPQHKNSQYTESPYEEDEDFTSQANNTKSKVPKKVILIIAVVALIALACGVFYLFNQANNTTSNKPATNSKLLTKQSEDEDNVDGDDDVPEEGTTVENGFETGDSNSEGGKYEEGTLSKTTPEHYSSSDFLKDLNGYEIPAVYTVQNITYDVAHVNYQAKRATIDDGMEFYWLEIDYNGKKYRAQCSYNMFRNLESEGICKVAVEILTLDSGQQVVSYMKVVSEDYTVDDAENDFNF